MYDVEEPVGEPGEADGLNTGGDTGTGVGAETPSETAATTETTRRYVGPAPSWRGPQEYPFRDYKEGLISGRDVTSSKWMKKRCSR